MDAAVNILFKNSPNGACFVSPDGRFLRVNARLCQMLGYTEQQLLAIDFQSITHFDDLVPDMVNVQRVLDGEVDSYSMIKRYRHGVNQVWMWAKLFVGCVRHGDGTVHYFVAQIEEISTHQLQPEQWQQLAVVKNAIAQSQMDLHWQPIISLDTGYPIGYEGLIRWLHPEQGIKYPGSFIPLLEKTQNLHLITHYVLSLLESGRFPSGGWISINVDNGSMQRPDWATKSSCLYSNKAHIEILETALISPDVEQMIQQLRENGCAIAIDDYGSGFSNPSLLTRENIPCDILKVDMELIQQLGKSDRAYELCHGITQFSRRWNLQTIAEGVETEQQSVLIRELGFDMAQGRLFGWPEPLGGSSSASTSIGNP